MPKFFEIPSKIQVEHFEQGKLTSTRFWINIDKIKYIYELEVQYSHNISHELVLYYGDSPKGHVVLRGKSREYFLTFLDGG